MPLFFLLHASLTRRMSLLFAMKQWSSERLNLIILQKYSLVLTKILNTEHFCHEFRVECSLCWTAVGEGLHTSHSRAAHSKDMSLRQTAKFCFTVVNMGCSFCSQRPGFFRLHFQDFFFFVLFEDFPRSRFCIKLVKSMETSVSTWITAVACCKTGFDLYTAICFPQL